VVVERVFNAPRDAVWRAFTEPEQIAQWWGRGNSLVVERFELWRGGRWRFVEHADDGVHGFEGTYQEVSPPQRLVWTFAWDGMVGHLVLDTTTFEELADGRTRVVSRSLLQTMQERDAILGDGMLTGREQSYAALDRLLQRDAAADDSRSAPPEERDV
jgi:uncharacterized protein YndB with AHSA1/START domain